MSKRLRKPGETPEIRFQVLSVARRLISNRGAALFVEDAARDAERSEHWSPGANHVIESKEVGIEAHIHFHAGMNSEDRKYSCIVAIPADDVESIEPPECGVYGAYAVSVSPQQV